MGNELTFVLTDVESSTVLWERFPDQMSTAIAAHESIISNAVNAHGGELVRDRGEGDSTFAVFDSASAAVAAAAQAAHGLAEAPWAVEAPLRVRIAVYTGEVESRDGDYYGTTINRAARMRSLAFGGQILPSARTVELTGASFPGSTALVDLGPRPLKDLAEPEHVYELQLLDADTPPEPLSDAGASNDLWIERHLSAGFVDRDRERRLLVQTWASAAAGDRQLVLIEGEPGIGKTTIAAAAAHHVGVDGGLVLYGRWDEEVLAPYQAFREALGAYAHECPRSILRADLREHSSEIARLFPEIGRSIEVALAPDVSQMEAERLRLFDGIDAWLAAITLRRPVCLVLDDLHWADRASFLLLLHLIRAPQRIPLFIIATFRGDAITEGDSARFIPELSRNTNVQRISLGGLGRTDIEDLVDHLRGPGSGPQNGSASALAEELRAETGGNPLFLREIVKHLSENDALDVASRRGVRLPASVRELVRWRLRPLHDDTRETLAMASVIGQEFDAEVLATACGAEGMVISTALEESRRAGVLHDVGEIGQRYAFSHAVVRHALLDDLSGARRAGFHWRVGEALEQQGMPPVTAGQLAHHFCAAVTSQRAEKAIAYARAAADEAMRELAFEAAIVHLQRALEIQELLRAHDQAARAELLIALATAHDRLGGYTERARLCSEAATLARGLGRTDLFAAAALRSVGVLQTAAMPPPEGLALLHEAIDLLDGDSADRAMVLGKLAHALHMTPPRSHRVAMADEALSIARRIGDPGILAQSLVDRAFTLDGPDDLDDQLGTADEIRRLARIAGDRMLELRALHLRTDALFEAGDLDALRATLEEMGVLARELRFPEYLRVIRAWDAVFACIGGRLDDAFVIADEVRVMLEAMSHPQTIRDYEGLVFPMQWLRGHMIDRLELYESIAAATAQPLIVHMLIAWATSEAGMHDRAVTALDAIGKDEIRHLDPNFGWWVTIVGLSSATSLVGDEAWAELLYDLILPRADRLATAGSSSFIGSARHHLGELATVLGRYDEGAEHFEAAIKRSEQMESPPWLAMAQASYARLLDRRRSPGDAERATQLRSSARAVADELGLVAVRQRLD